MTKQERKFTLGEVHTKMGVMGEVRFDQTLLDVLGVKPEDFIVFTISTEGVVTVTGEKKAPTAKSAATTSVIPTDVSQPVLFDTGQPIPRPRPKRRTHR
jgi:hypothetical protein